MKEGKRYFIYALLLSLPTTVIYFVYDWRTSEPAYHKSSVYRPNILFIIADDLGYNDVGYHGSVIKTPNLDKLAMGGLRLENYYVQPICSPTRSQLLSGRYQIHTGLQHGIISAGQAKSIPLDSKTLADKLSDAGYSTHMVGKWHLGFHKSEYLPTRRGFQSFFGFLNGHNGYYSYVSKHGQFKGYDLRDNEAPADIHKYSGTYSTNLFTDKAIDIIRRDNKDKPWFIYLSYQAPHEPTQVPDRYLKPYQSIENEKRRYYAAMVSCLDEGIGNITKELQRLGIWDDTLLIFTTDNGAEHRTGSNKPLRGHKGSHWEGGIRATGFVHGEMLDKKMKGTVSREMMHVSDWFPTFISMVGGDLNGTKPLDGFDQWETIREGRKSKRNEILINIDTLSTATGHALFNDTFDTRIKAGIRVGKWKLITGQTDGGPKRKSRNQNLWLFDIEKDPKEYMDLSGRYPALIQNMLKKLQDYQNTAVIPNSSPRDPKANPKRNGGFWGPWMDK